MDVGVGDMGTVLVFLTSYNLLGPIRGIWGRFLYS